MAGASMAGQYDTFLDVADDDALLAAVRACWASIDSPRTRAYLQQNGVPLDRVAMAVVVQQLVPADVAGVLFTVNPHTGSRDEMLIEAAWGLGEAVVSGRVQPDVLRVRVTDGHTLEQVVADKHIMIRPGCHAEEPVPDARRRTACLEPPDVRQLHALGLRAAAHFKRPQDIEWAISGGKVYQLQSRPITTLDGVDAYHQVLSDTRTRLRTLARHRRGPWALHNLAETLPHPTPLTWSVIARFMSGRGGFGAMYRMAGFHPSPDVCDSGFLELVAGRVYMDASRAPGIFFDNYPFAYDPDLLRKSPEAAANPPTLPCGSIPRRMAAARRIAAANRKLHEWSRTLSDDLTGKTIPAFVAWCETEKQRDLAALSGPRLADLWLQREARVLDDFAPLSLLPSLIAGLLVEELRAAIAENLWDSDPEELAATLASPLTADRTLSANAALYDVSRGHLTLDAWLAEFGHRAPNEFDLAAPRWHEQRPDLQKMAARLASGPSPREQHDRHLAHVLETERQVAARFPGRARTDFDTLLARTRAYMRFREDGKYYLMLGYALLRDLALEAARRIAANGDVFFLTRDELLATLRGQPPADLPAAIATRRRQYAAEARLVLPRFIDAAAIDTLGLPSAHAASSAADRFDAFALSTGAARGPVRIVTNPASAGDLGRDYILVCTSTDPAWTPLFVAAAGLVLECGGTLSHGAVVAREMGIPAVVLPEATTLLRENEPVTVDGHTGAVYRTHTQSPLSPVSGPVDHRTSASQPLADPASTRIAPSDVPPPPGRLERRSRRLRRFSLALWSLYLLAAFLLPADFLYEPSLRLLDAVLWPLVQLAGRPGSVAIIAAAMAAATMIGQRLLTDNARLREARRRANLLQKEAAALPDTAPRRAALRNAAAGVTARITGAAMVPLALLLGPMVMTFMWLPARVDHASASAPPGTAVNVTALVDADYTGPVQLRAPGFAIDEDTPPERRVPPIRAALASLLSDPAALAKVTTRPDAAADLRRHLDHLPPHAIAWRMIPTDEKSSGRFPVTVTAARDRATVDVVLGETHAPPTRELALDAPVLKSLKYTYVRPAVRTPFWTPLAPLGYPQLDLGWLGVYLAVYLPVMFVLRWLLRLP